MAQVLTSTITATPFRVSFFGGGTDFPAYFNKRGGVVVASALKQYSYVALNSLERILDKRFRISYSRLELTDNVSEIKHDIVRAILSDYNLLIEDSFIDIHSYADLPSGTGIGSSSAFTVGMLYALHALNGIYLPPKDLAQRAINIERVNLEAPGGWQDQITASFGGFNVIEFRDNDFTVEPLILSGARRDAFERSCWLYFTATTRSSADVQRAAFSAKNILNKERILDATRELALEAVRLFRTAVEPEALVYQWGKLLDQAWTLKRSMSDSVSLPEIDRLYDRAKRAGAYGGKIIGAGGGGFLLIVAPPDSAAAIDEAVGNLHRLPVYLETNGSRVIYVRERPPHATEQSARLAIGTAVSALARGIGNATG